MGIDSRILVRIPAGFHQTLAQVKAAAVAMCKVIGAQHFLITAAWENWSGEKHHAISAVAPASADDFYEPTTSEARALIGKVCFFQDGPPIIAEAGEQFLQVHISQRYYGEGYERGSWPVIRTTLEWLAQRWPLASVWYGGDSSGVTLEHYTPAMIARVQAHYLSCGHEPYRGAFGRNEAAVTCPICEVQAVSCGGGGGSGPGSYTFHACDGCGSNYVRGHDGEVIRVTSDEKRADDFGSGWSAAAKRLKQAARK